METGGPGRDDHGRGGQEGGKRKSGIESLLPLENLENVSERTRNLGQIALAVIGTAFVFAYDASDIPNTLGNIPIALFSVAIAIAFHELAHYRTAKVFGIDAPFKLWLPGFASSLLLALIGIKVAIVGGASLAAYKFSRWGYKGKSPTFRETGWIGGVGSLSNIALGAICGAMYQATGLYIFQYMMNINAWIALFNLVPIKDLDGGNVFFWKPSIWFLLVLLCVLLLTPFGISSYFAGI